MILLCIQFFCMHLNILIRFMNVTGISLLTFMENFAQVFLKCFKYGKNRFLVLDFKVFFLFLSIFQFTKSSTYKTCRCSHFSLHKWVLIVPFGQIKKWKNLHRSPIKLSQRKRWKLNKWVWWFVWLKLSSDKWVGW